MAAKKKATHIHTERVKEWRNFFTTLPLWSVLIVLLERAYMPVMKEVFKPEEGERGGRERREWENLNNTRAFNRRSLTWMGRGKIRKRENAKSSCKFQTSRHSNRGYPSSNDSNLFWPASFIHEMRCLSRGVRSSLWDATWNPFRVDAWLAPTSKKKFFFWSPRRCCCCEKGEKIN